MKIQRTVQLDAEPNVKQSPERADLSRCPGFSCCGLRQMVIFTNALGAMYFSQRHRTLYRHASKMSALSWKQTK